MSDPFYAASGTSTDHGRATPLLGGHLTSFGRTPVQLTPPLDLTTPVYTSSDALVYFWVTLGGKRLSTTSFGGSTWNMANSLGATALYRVRVGTSAADAFLLHFQVATADYLRLRLVAGGRTFSCELQSQVPNFAVKAPANTGFDGTTQSWATLGCVFTSPTSSWGATMVQAFKDGVPEPSATAVGKSAFSTAPTGMAMDASAAASVDVAAVLLFDHAFTESEMAQAHTFMKDWTGARALLVLRSLVRASVHGAWGSCMPFMVHSAMCCDRVGPVVQHCRRRVAGGARVRRGDVR